MSIDEKTRLDLRRAFEELIGPDLAAAAMEAMPNLDYDELATKADVAEARLVLRSEMTELRAELRGEMAELRADMRTEMADMSGALETRMASNLRIMVASHLATTLVLLAAIANMG